MRVCECEYAKGRKRGLYNRTTREHQRNEKGKGIEGKGTSARLAENIQLDFDGGAVLPVLDVLGHL